MSQRAKGTIGILTFHRTLNYGAVLQCYALMRVINDSGYNASVIDYRSPMIEQREMRPRIFLRKNVKNFVGFPFEMLMKYVRRRSFAKSKIKASSLYGVKSDIDLVPQLQGLDSVVVGSDQVWNLGLTGGDFQYFLPGPGDFKKNSYAASFGSRKVAQAERVARYLDDFNYVGVREADGVRIAHEMGIDASQVLDPTLLLTPEQWKKVSAGVPHLPDKYIVAYAVNMKEDVVSRAKKIAEEHHASVVYIHGSDWTPVKGVKNIYSAGPDEFIYLIRNAEAVVTSSFHGTCFAMLMHRPFTVVMNHWKENANSRLESLLQLVGVDEKAAAAGIVHPVWEDLDDLLESERERSLNYLKQELI